MKEDDDTLPSGLDFDLPEMSDPEPDPEPLPLPKSKEDLKAALSRERFLELSGDEQFVLVAGDMAAAYQMLDAGSLEKYDGMYVAVLKRQFVGAYSDPVQLLDDISRQYDVHPRRIAEIFIDDGS